MEINTRNRNELKSYFVRNAIPTQSNFEDLIDGILNFKEDGIVKRPDSPLSLEAAGTNDTSEKAAIHFYQDFDNTTAEWVFSLNPFGKSGTANTARRGFNIADGPGNSRLFIDRESGNVGLGTITPAEQLHLTGSVRGHAGGALRISTGSGFVDVGPKNANWSHFYTDRPAYYFDKEIRVDTGNIGSYDDHLSLRTSGTTRMTILNTNGNVGIGTTSPSEQLQVNGRVIAGNLTIGAWPANANYAFLGTNAIDQSVAGNYSLLIDTAGGGAGRTFLNSSVDIRFRINNNDRMTLANDGNVGIGTNSPAEQLHINGSIRGHASGAIRISSGNGYVDVGPKNAEWSHFYTDRAKYYFDTEIQVDTGRIGSYNENLYLRTSGTNRMTIENSGGNVGIGITNPAVALHIAGNRIRIQANSAKYVDIRTDGSHLDIGASGGHLYINNGGLNTYVYNAHHVSSADTKNNIELQSIDDSLLILQELQPVTFAYKTDTEQRPHIGFIAEHTPEILTSSDHKAIDYNGIVAVLTNVVNQQQAQIHDLQTKVEQLSN